MDSSIGGERNDQEKQKKRVDLFYEIKPYCEALETFFVDFIPNPT